MAARLKSRLPIAVLCALAVTAGALTYELHADPTAAAKSPDPTARRTRLPSALVDGSGGSAGYRYDRLTGPGRTVVRDNKGAVLATLTDGARTAVLTGPGRTFSEPRTTKSTVVTDNWVRLLPRAWKSGQERAKWFADWLRTYRGSRAPDVFDISLQYVHGAKPRKDAKGVRYAGAAAFGPPKPDGAPSRGLRREKSDFYQYLSTPWTFPDSGTAAPQRGRYGTVDSAGYVRLVYGYRSGYPLFGSDHKGAGLPRTANGMATVGPGVPVIADRRTRPAELDALQPGDLVFFNTARHTGRRLDHAGVYLGLDTEGHPRFISSREESNGPTLGDTGGDSRLDGPGYYGKGLRSAKRL
ncbi:NlpC/P60 family protein [Streptomyces sp. NPDC057654]|uniref:NlpC/P60 family protein n=1 Tax=Streptomyces sp. NPDC057654 TaxID=3346196 RepID=UPI0036C2D1C6